MSFVFTYFQLGPVTKSLSKDTNNTELFTVLWALGAIISYCCVRQLITRYHISHTSELNTRYFLQPGTVVASMN